MKRLIAKHIGKMAEWSIAAVLKTVEPRGSRGSNPCLSAESTEQNKRVSGQKPTNLRFVGFFIIAYKSCLQCLIRRKFGSPDNQWGYLQAHIYFISAGNLRQVDLQKYRSRPTEEIMG